MSSCSVSHNKGRFRLSDINVFGLSDHFTTEHFIVFIATTRFLKLIGTELQNKAKKSIVNYSSEEKNVNYSSKVMVCHHKLEPRVIIFYKNLINFVTSNIFGSPGILKNHILRKPITTARVKKIVYFLSLAVWFEPLLLRFL